MSSRVAPVDVVEREGAEHEVERAGIEAAEVAVRHEPVGSDGVALAGVRQHRRRDVDPGDVEAVLLQKAAGPPRPATEVQGGSARDVRQRGRRGEERLWVVQPAVSVVELQRRGRFRKRYTGTTAREILRED